MTLLVISPDYASHLLPLATLATAWRDAGERVVVATGPATDPIVREFGLERYDLPLGRGSNARVIRTEDQPPEESDSLRSFFDATRRGMVPTLRYQARERLTDLMWDPVDAGRRTLTAVQAVQLLEGYCEEFLYTHVDKEGLMQGTDMNAIKAVAKATERKLTAAGGITTREEIDALDALGIDAVVGMAIYTGSLALD